MSSSSVSDSYVHVAGHREEIGPNGEKKIIPGDMNKLRAYIQRRFEQGESILEALFAAGLLNCTLADGPA